MLMKWCKRGNAVMSVMSMAMYMIQTSDECVEWIHRAKSQ
jgi:hypothetical protein